MATPLEHAAAVEGRRRAPSSTSAAVAAVAAAAPASAAASAAASPGELRGEEASSSVGRAATAGEATPRVAVAKAGAATHVVRVADSASPLEQSGAREESGESRRHNLRAASIVHKDCHTKGVAEVWRDNSSTLTYF